ncbi:MAG: hypothetical protein M1821_003554 [Bathelium mastoideum]|nr:MAG: hypothetical protein M1821_003554 [Bathelium mastoideum]KAI9684842.1 MAG: hypothetical protein M1822_005490 [Bathelium mastoideum]
MPLHLGVSGHHGATAKKSQTAIRDARKMLLERVRDDWEYEPRLLPNSLDVKERQDPNRSNYMSCPLDWTERSYNTSSPSESGLDEGQKEIEGDNNDFKFESPDAVGVAVEKKRAIRKRKRQAVLEEEKSWNKGFAIFEARRDAWTGAQDGPQDLKRASYSTQAPPILPPSPPPPLGRSPNLPSAFAHATSDPSDPSPPRFRDTSDHSDLPLEHPKLIPIVEPILPASHPIRATINPSSYPQIYTEVVRNSRSPSIPINLADMIKACVQGWVNDGEWPPKASALEPSIAKRRRRGGDGLGHDNIRKGVEGVKRILRISASTNAGAVYEEG